MQLHALARSNWPVSTDNLGTTKVVWHRVLRKTPFTTVEKSSNFTTVVKSSNYGVFIWNVATLQSNHHSILKINLCNVLGFFFFNLFPEF